MQRIGSLSLSTARVSLNTASPVSSLGRCYFTTERKINKVGVVGLGLMGHGIVQISAQSGFKVVAFESDQIALETGTDRIKKSLEKISSKMVEKGKLDKAGADGLVTKALGNIQGTLKKEDLADCDLVIEAIIENIDIKRKLHAELAKITKPSAILATNTSSLSVNKIADATGRFDRTVGHLISFITSLSLASHYLPFSSQL
jgi:3-hydroxyacyl-CoA dehydrogenase